MFFHCRSESADFVSKSFAYLRQFLGPNTNSAIPRINSKCMG